MNVSGQAPGTVAARITEHLPTKDGRSLIAVSGPPASGKSTVSAALVTHLNAAGHRAALLPMDGFHLDNTILTARALMDRKGAPETFDRDGFAATVTRAKDGGALFVPTFDRTRDLAIAASAEIAADCDVVVIEGNYLLLDEEGWRDLATIWDFSIFFAASMTLLERRLINRWTRYGLSPDAAAVRARGNDIPNAQRILDHRLPADLTLDVG